MDRKLLNTLIVNDNDLECRKEEKEITLEEKKKKKSKTCIERMLKVS